MNKQKSLKNTKKISRSNAVTTDFGTRKISSQNFSKVIAIPKTALANLGRSSTMNVELVQENGEKFLKLSLKKGGKRK
ncbi:hypothetical protein [Nitrosopumilus sp.]|uniref:hypothetical protein n=1 Tax=Nitrosopumilus sp. TaxID=2024843 RepID=UPI0034A05C9C